MMIHIKRYLDKMAVVESKQSKDVVIPLAEARGLRDDISKLLADLHQLNNKAIQDSKEEIIQIEIKGGGFK